MLTDEKKASANILHNQMAGTELKVDCEHLGGEDNKNADAEDTHRREYLTGPRLLVAVSIVILASFLLFLDSSIIVTVSDNNYFQF